jgi:hypothetical protein
MVSIRLIYSGKNEGGKIADKPGESMSDARNGAFKRFIGGISF